LIAYAALGGADFGAGIWDFFALGEQRTRLRALTNTALGPVWETNHVWLIFLIVGLFTVFPSAFAILCVALFIPLTLSLVGIVLRGAALIFRVYEPDRLSPVAEVWSRVFSVASLLTPFFLGTAAAGVASGKLVFANGEVVTDRGTAWLSLFAIVIGLMAVSLCASLAAVYLAEEASHTPEQTDLAEIYRQRALIAGGVTAGFGAIGLLISPSQAPLLWQGMLNGAWPVVLATMAIGLLTALLLFRRRYSLARWVIILETAFILSSWGLSQYPYILPPSMTIDNSANDPNVVSAFMICVLVGMVLLLPSLYLLFSVFKLSTPAPEVLQHADDSGQH
jgi:cytochrome d ubiquinol oxidase subunit II